MLDRYDVQGLALLDGPFEHFQAVGFVGGEWNDRSASHRSHHEEMRVGPHIRQKTDDWGRMFLHRWLDLFTALKTAPPHIAPHQHQQGEA